VTSHQMEEMNEFCDRIGLIDRGQIVAVDTPAELKARIGPNATLDDVFINLVAQRGEYEGQKGYGEVRRTRRAAREHG
jgi:ABC-2 type transport system ATP-binding protein